MIRLFNPRRTRQLAGVVAVALVQLAATVTVAHAVHAPDRQGWAIAAVAAIVGFSCEALLRWLSEGLGLNYVSAVRDLLFRHLMAVDPKIIAARRHGAMLQSFVGDLTALRQWIAEGVMRAILALIALAGLLAWLCLASPRLGAIALVIVGLGCGLGATLLGPLVRAVQQVRRERGRVSAFASERLAASATVLACARAGSEARRLERRVERLNAASLRRAWLTGVLRALPHLVSTAIVIAAVLTNGPGGTSGMIGQVLVIGIIGLALRDLARAAELVVPGRISQRRIAKMLALPRLDHTRPGAWKRGETHRLVLDNLAVTEDSAPLCAEAARGEVVLVEGDPRLVRALFAVLAGLANPLGGTARWNGADLCARRPSERRAIVGLAADLLPGLPGSNGFNLRYRLPGTPERDQAELARVWHIDPLGHGEDPHRLALVRALLGQPPLLLLAPDDRALRDADAKRLAAQIGAWPGVVLLSSGKASLSSLASQRWLLTSTGLAASALPDLPHVLRKKERAA